MNPAAMSRDEVPKPILIVSWCGNYRSKLVLMFTKWLDRTTQLLHLNLLFNALFNVGGR
jgi:hypothetical protein